MNCKEYRALIGRLIDSRLNEVDKRQLEEHLNICHKCTTYFQNLQKLGGMANKLELSGDEEYWIRQKDAVLEKIDKFESLQNKIIKVPSKQYRDYVYRVTAIAASIALVAFISIYESREFKNIGPMRIPRKIGQAMPDSTQVKDMEIPLQKFGETQTGQLDENKKQESQENIPTQKIPSLKKSETSPPPSLPAPTIESNVSNTMKAGSKPAVEEAAGSVHDKYETSGKAIISREQAVLPHAKVQIDKKVMADQDKAFFAPSLAPTIQVQEKYMAANKAMISRELDDSLRAKGDIQLNMAESKSERVDSLEIYMQWRRKLEYLETRYADILSPHYQESTAKGRIEIPKDSLNTILGELAEAYYRTGFYSADKIEKNAMLDKLQELARKADAETAKLIQSYIDRLEPSTK